MHLTFRAKLLASHVGLVVAVGLLVIFELDRSLSADLERQLEQRLEQQAVGASRWVGSGRHPERLSERLALVVGARVSIFDDHGAVLGDSGPPGSLDTEPVASLPELAVARAGGVGHATRRAGAEEIHHVAVQAGEGQLLRLSAPLSGVNATVRAMRARLLYAAVLAFSAALALALIASRVASRPLRAMTRIAARMAEGDYAVDLPASSADEFGVLSRALRTLGETLQRDMSQIRKLSTIRRDFVANVSHELRTPVTAIQGYAETLLHGSADAPTARRFLETIHRHACRLGRLVENLLLLSELEARPPEQAVREAVALAPIVAQVLETAADQAKARGVTLTAEIAEGAAALGDPAAIEQLLENLVDNACKHGRAEGSVTIVVERRGERVWVAVNDDGPGIAAAHLARVFERFYRVDPGRSREQGGTGLGLAIVKHLAESMGGSATVQSEEGAGCSFQIELPAPA